MFICIYYHTLSYFTILYIYITIYLKGCDFMKKKIAITIDESVYEKIKQISLIEDRNISSQINKILKDYIKNIKK